MAQEAAARQEPSPFYTKPTYFALSQAINRAISSLEGHEQIENTAYQHLKDQLFLSPRLEQWKRIVGGIGDEFRIYNNQQNVFVSVYRDHIVMERAGDQYTLISDPILAETLFNNLESAQALVQARIREDETDPEAFFSGNDSDFYEGAGLDAALEETHSDALIEEDADLIQEVVGEGDGYEDEAYKNGEPGQIAVDEEESVQNRLHQARVDEIAKIDFGTKNHTSKINKSAASEAAQVKQEYKDVDPPVKDYPKTANTAVIARLKSLQGRLLNIVEASFTDKDQRAAVKTLVNKEFRREMNNFNKGSWNGFSALDED